MPVRLKPDGTIEFDTVDEALAYRRGSGPVHRLTSMLPSPGIVERAARSRKGLLNDLTPPATIEQAMAHPIAVALHEAYPSSMTFNGLAQAIGVEPAALTPRWGHLRRWIEKASGDKLSFADFLMRAPNPTGSGSIFSLSPQGEALMTKVMGGKK